MTFNHLKTLAILLICLAFVSQAVVSSVMPYQMMGMTGMNMKTSSQNMPMMDHSGHAMKSSMESSVVNAKLSIDNAQTLPSTSEDCCFNSCKCLAGGCSSAVALVKIIGHGAISNFPEKISVTTLSIKTQALTSLYRPPILS